MGERAHQEQVGTQEGPVADQGGSPQGAVQSLLARGRRRPEDVAALVRSYPFAVREILGFLQSTLGNGFVQAVVGLLTPQSPSAEPAAAVEGGSRAAGATEGPVRVTAHGLRIRRTPTTESHDNIVGSLHHGAVVTALAHEGDWVRIEHEGSTAFIHGHYVEPVGKPKAPGEAAPAVEPKDAAPTVEPKATVEPAAPIAQPAAAPSKPTVEPATVAPTPAPAGKPKAHAPTSEVASTSAPKDAKPPHLKAVKSGFTASGGGTVHSVLTRLTEEGKLKLTGNQIALLDAVAKVETGGQIASVQTYDDQIMSVGFKQVVLGHGSLEKIMQKAPAGFAKHGLSLNLSATYKHAGWSKQPHQINGCENEEDLRSEQWALKFYAASMEPDVIGAMCELALGEFAKVEAEVAKSGAGIDYFSDPTAQGWLLETYNNRPAFTPKAVKRAVDNGAKTAATRDAFLDILAHAIVETYVIEEPLLAYHKALKAHDGPITPAEDAALREHAKQTYEKIGRRKGTNIITKIPRKLDVPNVGHGENKDAKPPAPAPAPAPTVATGDHDADEHHDAPKAHHARRDPAHHRKAHDAPAHPDAHAATPHDAPHPETPAVTPVSLPKGPAHTPDAPIAGPTVAAPTGAPKHDDKQPTLTPAAAPTGGPAIHKIYTLPHLPSVHVFTPPGGAKGACEVFLFLHGKFAHHKADPHPEESMHLAQAMARTGRNLVTLAPAAHFGGKDGEWPLWTQLAEKNGYATLIERSLQKLTEDLPASPALTAGSISVAGHSAGGSALGAVAAQLGDEVHDITMQDGGYGGDAFNPSHAKLVEWLLGGESDKLLRVIVHGNIDKVSEGHALKSHINPESIGGVAKRQHLAGVTITREEGDHDARSVQGMYLHHRLHINGLKGARTVSVFNMPADHHMDIRNKTTDHLIEEGRDTDFAGTGTATGATSTSAPAPSKPKVAAPQPVTAHPTPAPTPQPVAPQPAPVAPRPAPQVDTHAKGHGHTSDAAPVAEPKAKPEPKAKAHGKAHHHVDDDPLHVQREVAADLTNLSTLVASVHNPRVTAVAQHVTELSELSKHHTAAAALDNNEVTGAARAEIVTKVFSVREEIKALQVDIDPAKLTEIKAAMFRAVQEVTPYHSQGRNVDILESNPDVETVGDPTRTCNITSLSMALEGLGKSAADYGGNRDTLLAVATYFRSKLGNKADLQGRSDGTSWGDVAALRMPDFMELVAISQCLASTAKKNKTTEKTDNASILAAAREAWPKIKSIDFLATLARSFGATASVRHFNFDPHAPAKKGHEAQDNTSKDSEHLGGQTKDTRKEIDKLIDARNRAEMATDPAQKAKLQKAYEAQKTKDEKVLTGSKVEKDVPLERYKQAIKDTLGAELAAGAAIETHVIGHFVRLRAIHDDHVVIDDPGQWARAHKTVLWEEARAQGMFERRLVIT